MMRVTSIKRGASIRALFLGIAIFLCLSCMSMPVFAAVGTGDDGNSQADSESSAKAFVADNVSIQGGTLVFTVASLRSCVQQSLSSSFTIPVTLNDGSGTVYISNTSIPRINQIAGNNAQGNQMGGKVSDISDSFSVEADLTGASTMLSGLQPIAALVTGLVCYIVVVGMGVFTAFDIMFIAFPIFREKCENSKADGGNAMMVKRDKNTGENKLRWVTDEAQYAVQQTSVQNDGRSPWGIYLKKRVFAYILLAIVLYILVTGNITLIVNFALNMISGLMEQLATLGA